MRIFLTGATGFIGSHIIPELRARGHDVTGLARSDTGAHALAAAGAKAHRGTLADLDSLRAGAARADAIIHTAFDHDFSRFAANCETDRQAIEALGEALRGSDRPLLITSGVGMGDAGDGRPATEAVFNPHHPNPRVASELAGQKLLDAGVNLSVMRLPQVHDTRRQGLVSLAIDLARDKGRVAYVGEGLNRWAAAHVTDVARLYALAIERAEAGARYHAVAEEGVAARDIARAVGEGLGLPVVALAPEQAADHFGWFAMFAAADLTASSARTRAMLGWTPTGPDLLADLRAMDYAAAGRRA